MLNEDVSFSIKHKLKSSMCCFRSDRHQFLENEDDSPPRTPRSPCTWLKSTAHELPELRGRCRNIMSKINRSRRRHHQSADFSYDPSSYALNFEDYSRNGDEFPLRDFTARLPASQSTTGDFPGHKSATVRNGIVACS